MDSELAALASVAAAAVVKLLTTAAWERTKAALGKLWRKVHPERAETVEAELAETRAELIAAKDAGDDQVAGALVGEWQGRLRRLLASDPAVAVELRRLLEEDLRPALADAGQRDVDITMNATAFGSSRVYQAGHDQHVTER